MLLVIVLVHPVCILRSLTPLLPMQSTAKTVCYAQLLVTKTLVPSIAILPATRSSWHVEHLTDPITVNRRAVLMANAGVPTSLRVSLLSLLGYKFPQQISKGHVVLTIMEVDLSVDPA